MRIQSKTRVRHAGVCAILVGALLVGPATAAAAAAQAEPTSGLPVVPVVEVRTRGVPVALELDATLQAVRQSTVAAQVGGNVVLRLVQAGETIRAAQPLVRIDERQTQAGLARSDAAVAQAQAELAEAQAAFERSRQLVARGYVSQAALDAANARLQVAQGAQRQATAERSQAALARNFATVVAPYDGVVLATHVESGDYVAPGRAIATVYAPNPIRAVVHVPASQQATVRASKQVEVRLPSGERVVAVSRESLPGVDPVSQTIEFRFDLPAQQTQGWIPGRSARVRFAHDSAARLVVPESAILRRGELVAVYVERGDVFALRAVRTGAVHGEAGIEVLAGLAEGERIAVDPVRAGLRGATPGSISR